MVNHKVSVTGQVCIKLNGIHSLFHAVDKGGNAVFRPGAPGAPMPLEINTSPEGAIAHCRAAARGH